MSDLTTATDETFERAVLGATGPMLVQSATERAGRLTVAEPDAEANPRTALRFAVQGVAVGR